MSDLGTIQFYRSVGEYGFLSNLFRAPITFEGRSFLTAEHAYQFGKPKDPLVAEWIVAAPRPHLVAAAAHALFTFDIRADWQDVKVERMRRVLVAKFSQHAELRELLLATGGRALEEASRSDPFWGTGRRGDGHNMLGVLLMDLRSALQSTDHP